MCLLGSNELAEACRGCLSAKQAGEALIPRLEVVERCVVMLLNVSPLPPNPNLEFLTKLERLCGHVDLAAAFAFAAQDILRQKGRHVSRDAWDLGTGFLYITLHKLILSHCLSSI